MGFRVSGLAAFPYRLFYPGQKLGPTATTQIHPKGDDKTEGSALLGRENGLKPVLYTLASSSNKTFCKRSALAIPLVSFITAPLRASAALSLPAW